MGCLGTHGKDVKYQRCAVQNLHVQHALYGRHLLGGEFIVKDCHTHLILHILHALYVITHLLQFTLTHVCGGKCLGYLLGETAHHAHSGGIGQELKFVKILICLALVLILGYDTYQYGGFGFLFGYDLKLLFHLSAPPNTITISPFGSWALK